MASGPLGRLPPELIELVFSYLSPQDCITASCLSSRLNKILTNSVRIQYKLDLHKYGMIDGGGSMSTATKRNELLLMERAWETLDQLSRHVSLKVVHNPSTILDVSGGVITFGNRCGLPRTSNRDTKSLRFFNLSSCKTGSPVPDDAWRHLFLPDRIVDVGLAHQEHDLIAVVCLRSLGKEKGDAVVLHLRQPSGGGKHPFANKHEIIVARTKRPLPRLSVIVQIVGPCLMLLIVWPDRSFSDGDGDHLLLINWWTGEIVIRQDVIKDSYSNFVFLSEDLVLLPNLHEWSFDIILLPDLTSHGNQFFKTFNYVTYFELPPLNRNCKPNVVSCHASPNPFGALHPKLRESGESQNRCGRRPFFCDPSQAIVLVRFSITETAEDPALNFNRLQYWIDLVFHRCAIIDAVHDHVELVQPIAESEAEWSDGIIVPWERWSTNVTRWFVDGISYSTCITRAAGQRLIGRDRAGRFFEWDLNPYTARRKRFALQATNGNDSAVTDNCRSIFVDSSVRDDSVKATLERLFALRIENDELPYVLTIINHSQTASRYHGIIIEEEKILGVKFYVRGVISEVDVFWM